MAINSAEFPYDMSAWVYEKSYKVLRKASLLVEWLHRNEGSLSAEDREEVEDALFHIVRNGAALLAFGCENTQAYSPEWVSVIAAQGRERLEEFSKLAAGRVPADTKPAEFPESAQRVLDLFSETIDLLRSPDTSRTLTRVKLIELGEMLTALRKKKDDFFVKAGDRLLELVDKQSFHASISWPDLVTAADALIEEARTKYLEAVERYRWRSSAELQPEAGE